MVAWDHLCREFNFLFDTLITLILSFAQSHLFHRIYIGLMQRNKMTSLGVEVTITSLIAFTYDDCRQKKTLQLTE